jgi:predicted lipid-binding transport protein (Tim44 family)
MQYGQYFLAGVAGILAIKILAGLVLPLIAVVFGLVGMLIKFALIGAVIWFVMRMFRGKRREASSA